MNYDDTEYDGNPRDTKSKALRLYKKEDDQWKIKYAILEIIFKRNWLKKKNIVSIADELGQEKEGVPEKVEVDFEVQFQSVC